MTKKLFSADQIFPNNSHTGISRLRFTFEAKKLWDGEDRLYIHIDKEEGQDPQLEGEEIGNGRVIPKELLE